ncbi:hypothetical protein [Dyadobacter fermentans]|uniref:Uncharacterized protein n=1 Tax=Dyadobacter fermentans (strain ATCC 700827 / DSM 18053 / CIP 107007 / KCTC 52180 / NS114) TaxID=471854 RepID=C6VVH0_DYAFD|nr:hypothetical protein [Dyadobacter fermentans]ACT96700.1 hypothetical protein Dfer_5509 [Dyadobacter fermentans DSM 18053]
MAEETNKNPEPEKSGKATKAEKVKTKQVEIIKFHPLVAHEVGEQPILTEEKADELIEKKYAKALK